MMFYILIVSIVFCMTMSIRTLFEANSEQKGFRWKIYFGLEIYMQPF